MLLLVVLFMFVVFMLVWYFLLLRLVLWLCLISLEYVGSLVC